jgi:hypothetical protein
LGNQPRRSDEILGATVVLTGWSEGRDGDVKEALGLLSTIPAELDRGELPIVVLAKTSLEKAEAARRLLEEAGANVELEDAWVTRDTAAATTAKQPCPFCGSTKTQRFTHSGPGARASMKCTTCGQRFRVPARPA